MALEYISSTTTKMLELLTGNYGFLSKKPERANSPNMELVLKEETSFRIKKIEVVKYEAIDQIKMSYNDDTEWTYGHDLGDEDPRALVMTEGEYLVRVTHEKLESQESAGAMVEFETNKGRIFIYKPSELDSISFGDGGELATIWAQEGYEIISLKIRTGELLGSEQQRVPAEELIDHPKEWYVLSYSAAEEDFLHKEDDQPAEVASGEKINDTVNPESSETLTKENKQAVEPERNSCENVVGKEQKTVPSNDGETAKSFQETTNDPIEGASKEDGSENDNEKVKSSEIDFEKLPNENHVENLGNEKLNEKQDNIDKSEKEKYSESFDFKNGSEKLDINENDVEKLDSEHNIENLDTKDDSEKLDISNDDFENSIDSETDYSEDVEELDSENGSEKLDSDSEKPENEFKDDYIKYTHFSSKQEALYEWNATKNLIKQKEGRSGILIDCITSKIIRKAGDSNKIEDCRDKATLRGLCLPLDEENAPVVDIAKMLYKTLANKTELFLFTLSFVMMFLNFFLGIQISLLEGQILTALVTDQSTNAWRKMNQFEKILCRTSLLNCDGSYLALCKSLLLTYIIGTICSEIINILYGVLRSVLSESKTAKMGRDMFFHVLELDKSFFDTNVNFQNGMNVGSLHELLFDTIPSILTSALRYLIVAYSLIAMDFNVGLFSVLFTTFYNFFIYNYFLQLETNKWKKNRRMQLVQSKITSDTFGMIKTVKFFAKERFHTAEYKSWFNAFIEEMKQSNSWAPLRGLLEEVMHLFVYCGIVYFGYMNKASSMGAADFTGFVILYGQLHGLYATVRDSATYVRLEFCDVQRYKALKATKPKMRNGTKKLDDIQGEIKFNNVKFRYPSRPKDKVLKGLNLTIKPNCTTAIVGKSGAGKSTLAMLITRLYDPESGSITIDGHDMKTLDVEHLRSNIAIVDQSPELFNRTLADNIAYGVVNGVECTEEMVEKAGKIANCDFISKFREGYYTFAGYGGSSLSGGQLQRIAIARAAIRDPKILILDEATSALDAENEKEVQAALENLMKGRTVIVIAHRLSTIRNADRILCLKEGELAEEGTHDELLDKNGIYYNLVSAQIMERKQQKEEADKIEENEGDNELLKEIERRKQSSNEESDSDTDTSVEEENEQCSNDEITTIAGENADDGNADKDNSDANELESNMDSNDSAYSTCSDESESTNTSKLPNCSSSIEMTEAVSLDAAHDENINIDSKFITESVTEQNSTLRKRK